MYIKKVQKAVALNPVARAIARQKLKEEITTGLIKLYMLAPRQECGALIHDIGTTLGIIGLATELDPKLGRDLPECRIVRGGVSACQQILKTELWDPTQTVALDLALNTGLALLPKISPHAIQRACVALFSSEDS